MGDKNILLTYIKDGKQGFDWFDDITDMEISIIERGIKENEICDIIKINDCEDIELSFVCKNCMEGDKMTVEQANGNYNYMYEFRIDKSWYPCHLLNDSVENGHCMIFTRNGSIISERLNDVRKMRKKDYLQNRKEVVEWLGKWAYNHGIHENVDDDLRLFNSVDDLVRS